MVRRQEDVGGFRIPPQAVEVEKHVIGAALLNGEAAATMVRELREDDFYLEKHQVIHRAIAGLVPRHELVDIITIRNFLEKSGRYDMAGGDNYLMEISSEVVSDANIQEHCNIVKEKAMLRRLIGTSVQILEDAYASQDDAREILDRAEQRIFEVAENLRGKERGLRDMATILADCANQWDEMAEGKINRVRTGIATWDEMTGGFRIPSINLLAAEAGVGKSALALQATVQCGVPTAFFAMEMSAMEEIERMMAQQDPSLNAAGLATPEQVKRKMHLLKDMMLRLLKVPVHIDDRRRMTTLKIEQECRRMKRKHGLGLIVVDYVQLLRPSSNARDINSRVADVSEELQNISDDLQAPILAVASLNRELNKRENKRPIMADLRGSGDLEFDAHTITYLYQEARYNPAAKDNPAAKNVTELILPKIRGGKDRRSIMRFDGERSWFSGMSDADQKAYWAFLSSEKTQQDMYGAEAQKGAAKGKRGKPSLPPDAGKQIAMLNAQGRTPEDNEPPAF